MNGEIPAKYDLNNIFDDSAVNEQELKDLRYNVYYKKFVKWHDKWLNQTMMSVVGSKWNAISSVIKSLKTQDKVWKFMKS